MKMKSLHSLTLTLLVSLSLVRLPAKAELLQATDPRFGPNSLTIDTAPNFGAQLAWLDLTASAGLTYNQVLVGTGYGGIFSGYRLASDDEIRGLLYHAGIPGTGVYPLTNGSIQSLISLLGPTVLGGGTGADGTRLPDSIFGVSGSYTSDGRQDRAQITFHYDPPIGTYDYVVSAPAPGLGVLRTQSSTQYGYWLVTEAPVPEPSACSMTIAGLIGLAFVKRRKRGGAGSRV
jgi:hypothetical protein